MRTQRVGTIELDQIALKADLERLWALPTVQPYQEFVCGWPSRSVTLWAPGGLVGDGVISHYDESATPGLTANGARLPYVAELLEKSPYRPQLLFARLALLASNVLVPHRDYLEFEESDERARPQLRLHVPLRTNAGCLFSDDNTIFRMNVGEVWILDVTRVHGAVAFTEETRVHLILDLARDGAPVLDAEVGVPPENVVDRPLLSEDERDGLVALADVIDADNIKEVFGIIAKKQYRWDGGDGFFWETVAEISRHVPDPDLARHLVELQGHFLRHRSE